MNIILAISILNSRNRSIDSPFAFEITIFEIPLTERGHSLHGNKPVLVAVLCVFDPLITKEGGVGIVWKRVNPMSLTDIAVVVSITPMVQFKMVIVQMLLSWPKH